MSTEKKGSKIGQTWSADVLLAAGLFLVGFAVFFYLLQHRVAVERMEDELEEIRRVVIEYEQSTRDFLVENENFIIEDYTFKEYKKHE